MSPFEKRQMRMEHAREFGPQEPMVHCLRAEFCPQSYICNDALMNYSVGEELKRLDPHLEIVYDYATSGDVTRPGHHIYRVKQRGGTRQEDKMVLVLSLQHDMDATWPIGEPRSPGHWVVEAYKKFDTSGKDVDLIGDAIERHKNLTEKRADDLHDQEIRMAKEIAKESRGGDKRVKRLGRGRRRKMEMTPKTQVRI